jgi:hypothetical protein
MAKGRPGGNPELSQYHYTTDRPESLTSKLSIRIEPSVFNALKQQENWQEDVRRAIAKMLHDKTLLSEELRDYYRL